MTPGRLAHPRIWLLAAALLVGPAAQAQPAPTAPGPSAGLPGQAAGPGKPAAPAGEGGREDKKLEHEPDTLILSDTLNYDDIKKESVFTGNVIMTRGLLTLRADKLVMHEDPDGFQYGTATEQAGALVFVRQENPEKFEVVEAKGLRAEYNGKTEEFEMIGNAVVTKFVCGKPFDTISGARVKYNQSTSTYQAFSEPGASGGKRVRSVAAPTARSEAAAQECRQKSEKS